MDTIDAATLFHQYQRYLSMTDPLRYSCTPTAVQASGNIFGMDFETLFSIPPNQQAAWFIRQQEQADLLRQAMAGHAVSSENFVRAFGFSLDQLRQSQTQLDPIRHSIPDKLVVLTFDDAFRDQYELAVPILNEYGFHATFFVTEMPDSPRGPGFQDKNRYMTWDQITDLAAQGFELGNHTKNHLFGLHTMDRDIFLREIHAMEEDFTSHGLPKPISFAYPSGTANGEAASFVRECGYRWARGNCETGVCGMRGMSTYVPEVDSPLALPSFGDPDFYSEALMRSRIALAANGNILGLTYHSVSPDTWPGSCSFARQMELLAQSGCTVLSVRDLEHYIDPVKADLWNPI